MKGRNKRDNKTKYLLILLLLIAVGYAAIATTLKINGSSSIKSAKWDVYWENPHVIDGSITNTAPTLEENDTKATFNVTLNEPGDYYEFTIDAVNNGSLDAKIDTNGIVQQVKNSSGQVVNPTILKYEVTNNDQEHTAIQEGHILAKKSGNTPTKETYRVRVEYRNDEGINPSDLDDTNDLVFTIEFSVKYVQGPKASNNSGSNTPSNSYLTTFDETYEYDYYGAIKSENNEWVSTLNPNVNLYLRHSNSKTEACVVFGSGQSGTVCLVPNPEGYYSDFEDVSSGYYNASNITSSGLKGYTLAKVEEMLSKGASSCHVDYDGLQCSMNSLSCGIGNDGQVSCEDLDEEVWATVQPNGSSALTIA